MIGKKPRFVTAFYTTHDAMAFEEYCHENNIPGRLIPLPGEISAGCGLAWSSPPEEEGLIRESLPLSGIVPQEMRVIMA